MEEGSIPGRVRIYNMFREVVDPTAYAKGIIIKAKVTTVFSLNLNSIVIVPHCGGFISLTLFLAISSFKTNLTNSLINSTALLTQEKKCQC